MQKPQSLLAELRALEARRAQGSLTPAEEQRLAELRAVAGPAPAPAPRGFDVNAAAAVVREEVAPVALPAPVIDAGALGPGTPFLAPELTPPEAAAPAPELAPLPGADAGHPEGYDLVPPAAAPERVEVAAGGYDVVPSFDAAGGEAEGEVQANWAGWQEPVAAVPGEGAAAQGEAGAEADLDPAVAARWEAFARAQGWDPNAPWDPEAVAAQWDAFLRSEGWETGAAQPAEAGVAPPAWDVQSATTAWEHDTGAPGWDANAAAPGPAGTASWSAGDIGELPAEAPAAPPSTPGPAPEHDTASWDLSGQPPEAEQGAPLPHAAAPDHPDTGTTAIWSLGQVGAAGPERAAAPPPDWSEEPEPVLLDEIQLESEGSFGAPVPAAPASEAPAQPAAPAPAAGEAPLEAWPTWGEAEVAQPPPDREAPVQPVEAADDQILEVGEEVTEVAAPAPAAAPATPPGEEELPLVEADDVAEEVPEEVPEIGAAPHPPAELFAKEQALGTLLEELPAEPEPPVELPPVSAEPHPPSPLPEGEPVPLESLAIEEEPLEEPLEEPPARPFAGRIIPGLHRVVVHTIEGQVVRGVLQDPDLLAPALPLAAQPAAAPEPIPCERVRAIFFMLAPGEKAPEPSGTKVRVTFRDGRQVAGFSPDYDPVATGFFMIPVDSRTNTARIWVYRSAVRQVAVS